MPRFVRAKYTKTKRGTAMGNPMRRMAKKKPRIQPKITSVRFSTSSEGRCAESWKSTAFPPLPASGRNRPSNSSAPARQKTGIPMTRGKRAAFHGQAVAVRTAHAERAMMPRLRSHEALIRICRLRVWLGTPRLDERVGDHQAREEGGGDDHGAAHALGAVPRHRDVEGVLRDLPP